MCYDYSQDCHLFWAHERKTGPRHVNQQRVRTVPVMEEKLIRRDLAAREKRPHLCCRKKQDVLLDYSIAPMCFCALLFLAMSDLM
jgi:hypothetical protein